MMLLHKMSRLFCKYSYDCSTVAMINRRPTNTMI